MKISTFIVEYFRSDGGAMMGVVPKAIWSKYFESDENNLVTFALRSLLIETGERIILVDNGIGRKQPHDFLQYLYIHGGEGLLEGLAARGVQPEAVTDMVLTHLHFDHCGGGVIKDANGIYRTVFPNARYWVGRRQWENALNPNPREADAYFTENLIPMLESGQLQLVDEPMSLCDGVDLRFAHGHTPGQIIPVVTDETHTWVYAADLIPTHLHIPLKYNMAYDLEVLKTMEEKERLLEEVVANDYRLIFEHDARFEACTVKKTSRGFRMDKEIRVRS